MDSVYQGFDLESRIEESEDDLMAMEGELRALAKKDQLSNKVVDLRKRVDLGRDNLRRVQQQKDECLKLRARLEDELKNSEQVERRRNEVALDTEKTLTETKFELENMKKEIKFLANNRNDLQVAY